MMYVNIEQHQQLSQTRLCCETCDKKLAGTRERPAADYVGASGHSVAGCKAPPAEPAEPKALGRLEVDCD